MRPPIGTLLLTLALPASAQAAAPWSSPVPLTPSGQGASAPALTYARDGSGIASWRITTTQTFAQFPAALRKRLALAAIPAGSSPALAGRDVGSVAVGPLPHARSRTFSLRATIVDDHPTAPLVRLGYSFGDTGGAIGQQRTLARVRLDGAPAAAVGGFGHAVVAWVQRVADDRTRVWYTVRRGRGRFGAPRVIRGSGTQSAVAVAINDTGQFVVAWERTDRDAENRRRRVLEARAGGVNGGVRGLQTLGEAGEITQIAAVVANSAGRTTVAWTSQDGGEELNEPVTVRAAVQPAASFEFRESTVIDRAGPGIERPLLGPSIAAGDGGTATLAYTLSGPFLGTPARVVTQDRRGVFGAPQQLAANGAAGRVAAQGNGAAVVPVLVGGAGTGAFRLDAAVRPPVPFNVPPPSSLPPFVIERVSDAATIDAVAAFAPGGRAVLLAAGREARFFARG